MDDLDALGPYETRFIQPYQATKRYICPSCNQHIARPGHSVVIRRVRGSAPPIGIADVERRGHQGRVPR